MKTKKNMMNFEDLPEMKEIMSNFQILYNSEFIIDSNGFVKKDVEILINEVDNYKKNTGIMICNHFITPNIFIYFIIFEDRIIILDQNFLPLFQPFFNKCYEDDSTIYSNEECMIKIEEIIQNKMSVYQEEDLIPDMIDKKTIQSNIKNQIFIHIIIKSYYRTNERHKKLRSNPESFNSNIEFNFSDFVKIETITNKVKINFNKVDQYLYILKEFDEQKLMEFKHEKTFYEQINECLTYKSSASFKAARRTFVSHSFIVEIETEPFPLQIRVLLFTI